MFKLEKTSVLILFLATFLGVNLGGQQRSVSSTQPAQRETAATEAKAESVKPNYEFFKKKVEPIFLKERPGHARCYGCHILENRAFHLEKLEPGSTGWTEEQSQSNYQNALIFINEGDPATSILLLHPLAPDAGGDAFHSGGRQFASQDDPDFLTIAGWVRGSDIGSTSSASSPGYLIYASNSAADTVDVIDPTINQVVQVISGIELPHGIAFSPDATRVYISAEGESVLDVVDRKSGKILQKVPLSGRPNNITITNDGSRVLVGIRSAPGGLDVIDTASLRRTKTIAVDSVHNPYVTPDGKYAVSGSLEKKTVSVINLQTEEMVWKVQLDHPVRPMAFEANTDGSTRRIFLGLSEVHGFAVIDFAKRAEVARIMLPDQPGGFGKEEGRMAVPSHGIGIAPDGKSLWVNSTLANAVFKYSLPDLNLVGHANLPEIGTVERPPSGSVPEWITFSPDSKFVYISDSAARLVSVVDTKSLKVVANVNVGEVPKRLKTLVLH